MKSTLPRDAVFLRIVTEDKEQDEVDCSTVFCDLGQFWARSWEKKTKPTAHSLTRWTPQSYELLKHISPCVWQHHCYWGFGNCFHFSQPHILASQVVVMLKNPLASAGDAGDMSSICRSGRSPGKGNGNPLQYSCLENPMDRAAWRATVQRVAKSQTQLKWPGTWARTSTGWIRRWLKLIKGQSHRDM